MTGEDRLTFLHGMCTNDVKGLPEWGTTYATMVTVKGAMVSDARIIRRPEDVLLDVEPATAEKVRTFLDQYLISEDAELHAETGLAVLGLVGPRSLDVLEAAFGVKPQAVRMAFGPPGQAPTTPPVTAAFDPRTVDYEGAHIVLMPSLLTRGEGVELLVPRASLEAIKARLLERGGALGLRAAEVDSEAVETVRIEEGVPRFGRDLLETTIPLEADLSHAISYNKGCYVGQEVIARATFRGSMNKKLVGLSLGEAEIAPQTELRHAGKKIGFITSVTVSPLRRERVALGYVHRAHLTPGTVLTVGEGPAEAKVLSLPLRAPAEETSSGASE